MKLSYLIAQLLKVHEERGDGFIVLRDRKNEKEDRYAIYAIPSIGKIVRDKTKINVDLDDYYYIEIGDRFTK